MSFPQILELFKQTFTEWNEDKAPRLGAALSYYTVFSIAPLLVILIAIVGYFYGEDAARGEISGQISSVVGPQAAEFIQAMVQGANKPSAGIIASVIGFFTLLLGAIGVFGQLQEALNTIWKVPPKPKQSFLETLKSRFTPFMMLIGVSFLLLTSLVVSAGIAALGNWLNGVLPMPEWVMQSITIFFGFGIVTVLFALIFRVLPNIEIPWRDVWIGAALTTFLFMIGQLGLGWYVGKTAADSTYGAAGSLVAVLLWVYWTSQILFFGAEFTQVYAKKYGSKVSAPAAIPPTADVKMQEGIVPGGIQAAPEQRNPAHRNLPAEARREEQCRPTFRESDQQRSQRELVEDLGAIFAGIWSRPDFRTFIPPQGEDAMMNDSQVRYFLYAACSLAFVAGFAMPF